MIALLDIPETAWPFLGGGILVLWTVREFLGHQRARTAAAAVTPATVDQVKGLFRRLEEVTAHVEETERQVGVLIAMHDHRDEDGVYVWHNRRSFVRTVQAIEDNQGELVEIMREHGAHLTTHGVRLEELLRRPPGDPAAA